MSRALLPRRETSMKLSTRSTNFGRTGYRIVTCMPLMNGTRTKEHISCGIRNAPSLGTVVRCLVFTLFTKSSVTYLCVRNDATLSRYIMSLAAHCLRGAHILPSRTKVNETRVPLSSLVSLKGLYSSLLRKYVYLTLA